MNAVKPERVNILPVGWTEIPASSILRAYAYPLTELRVLVGLEKHSDGDWWLHVSASHPDRLPTWDELKNIKELFIGKDKMAVSILPPQEEYVNVHKHCLHLWCNQDRRILPDSIPER